MEDGETPADVEERLLELFDDSPLNDEALTPEQEARVDALMDRLRDETLRENQGRAGARSFACWISFCICGSAAIFFGIRASKGSGVVVAPFSSTYSIAFQIATFSCLGSIRYASLSATHRK